MSSNGWHRVDPVDVPDEGRARSVVVDGRSVAMTRCGGTIGALENRCPHRAARSERVPSRTACCAVRGTATTTTR